MKKVYMLIIAATLGFGIIGCGGGGSSVKELAKITASNAEDIIKSYTFGAKTSEATFLIGSLLNELCVSGDRDVTTNGDLTTLSYDNCKINSGGNFIYIDGKVTYKTITFTNVDIKEYDNLKVTLSSGAKITIKDGKAYYKEQSSGEYTGNTKSSVVYSHGGNTSKTDNLSLELSGDNSKDVINIKGYSKLYSVDKWIHIVTNVPTTEYDVDSCPKSGKITLEGDDSYLEIIHNSATSVTVRVNGNFLQNYTCSNFNSKFWDHGLY
jgi:hypothetical protein